MPLFDWLLSFLSATDFFWSEIRGPILIISTDWLYDIHWRYRASRKYKAQILWWKIIKMNQLQFNTIILWIRNLSWCIVLIQCWWKNAFFHHKLFQLKRMNVWKMKMNQIQFNAIIVLSTVSSYCIVANLIERKLHFTDTKMNLQQSSLFFTKSELWELKFTVITSSLLFCSLCPYYFLTNKIRYFFIGDWKMLNHNS